MSGNKLTIRIHTNTDSLSADFGRIASMLEGFEVMDQANPGPCDLFIVDLGEKTTVEPQFVDNIVSSGTAKEVFLTAKVPSPEILIEAIRAGVKEFFPQPLREEEVKNALRKFRERMEKDPSRAVKAQRRKGKVIDVLGSKGGVGTTTTAVNLATSLGSLNGVNSVALIDMNLLFGEIPLFLGIQHAFDWVEVAKNISRLDATYLMGTLARHASGVYVLPSPPKLPEEHRVTPQTIERLLELMRTMFDYIVIDSGQSLDDISKSILKVADKVILVTILSLPCLINVKRLRETFKQFGYPSVYSTEIIVNRYHKKSLISPKDAEKSLEKEFLWSIPNDYQTTMSAINQGKPLSAFGTELEICKSFTGLAEIIAGKTEKKKSAFQWR